MPLKNVYFCLPHTTPGTRGQSHRHNGTGLNDGGHHEHLNLTASYVARPYAVVKDAIPLPELHLQGELEDDIPKMDGNYSVAPQTNPTYMEHTTPFMTELTLFNPRGGFIE